MRSIYKFYLDSEEVATAAVVKWLHVGTDAANNSCVWAIVDTDSEKKKDYKFYNLGTGWRTKKKIENDVYLGTIVDGEYVWHWFVKETNPEVEKLFNDVIEQYFDFKRKAEEYVGA